MNKWRYTRDTLLFSFPISLILRKFSQSFKLYFHAVYDICRSSHRRCSVRKSVLRNFAKFTGKRLFQSLFFNKVAGLKPVTLLKNRPWHRCFPVKFAKFLRTLILRNTSRRLPLYLVWIFLDYHNKCQVLFTCQVSKFPRHIRIPQWHFNYPRDFLSRVTSACKTAR